MKTLGCACEKVVVKALFADQLYFVVVLRDVLNPRFVTSFSYKTQKALLYLLTVNCEEV